MTAAENQPPPMTNKTAIDILIEDLLSGKLMEVLSNKERYKEIERQQIIDAANYGHVHDFFGDTKTIGQYFYEQTFGNSQNTPS